MANPTTNYGFVLPTSSDLVTDLPADFDVALQGVDTQMKTNANAAIAKAIVDAKGDLIAATAADTVSRIAVGANGTVLQANSATATGLEWAAPAGGGANWTAVNAGGTSLLGGVSTVTISGITAADKLMVYFFNVSSVNASSIIRITFNGDTAGNYFSYGQKLGLPASYAPTYQSQLLVQTTRIEVAQMTNTHFSLVGGYLMLNGGNAAGNKMFWGSAGVDADSGNGGYGTNFGGRWNNSATISSVTITSTTGNFDNGDIFVWKSA